MFRNNKPLPKYLTDIKLKISAYFIFETKDAKKDKIINFWKDHLSVMGDLIDMIFGAFSDYYVRLLKVQLRNFFQDIAKVHTI